MRTTTTRIVAVLTALVIVTAACSSSKKSTDAGGSTATTVAAGGYDADLAAKLPDKIKSAGTINVATDASYPPMEFFAADNTTIQGMDVDLAKALGEVLGVKVNVENATFDDIIPGLGTRYDLGMSSFTDTQDREQTVDFVTYFSAGSSFLVQKGKNQDLTSLDALCGKSVGVETGTTQANDATAQSTTCTTAGKQAVNVESFPTQDEVNLALSSGRVDVVMLDSPVGAYQVDQSNGAFEIVGKPIATAPYGIAVPKGSDFDGFTDALLAALQQLNSNGTYTKILKTWGLEGGAITDFQINGAIS